jgi:hypothetical protein
MSLKKKTKIYMGVPTTGTIVDSQAYALREIADLYKDHVELVYPAQCIRRIFHDFARNKTVEDFLASDCDILWFLDSDITPDKHVLDLVAIYGEKWEVAGATYPVFMNALEGSGPEVVFTCYKKNPQTGNLAVSGVPKEGLDFVDGLATGCLFIKREVFSKLKKPYFEFLYKDENREIKEGEDLGFCRKLSELGIKIFTDFSLVCKHEKKVCLLDVNNYAITYSNRNVLAYAESLKEEMQEAVKIAYHAGLQKGQKIAQQTAPKSTLWVPQ